MFSIRGAVTFYLIYCLLQLLANNFKDQWMTLNSLHCVLTSSFRLHLCQDVVRCIGNIGIGCRKMKP